MATLDDIPSLPSSLSLSLDDLVAVYDMADRRSPKKAALSEIADLLGEEAPTPLASDTDKLLYSPTIGEAVNIYGEGGRVERFTGNLADPTKFFIAGAPVFDFDVEGDNEFINLDLNGYCHAGSGDLVQYDATGAPISYILGSSGAWVWYLGSGTDPVLYTSTDVCEHVSQVVNWVPNPTYPELPPAPAFTAWDNSGFAVGNLDDTDATAAATYGDNLPMLPLEIYGGRLSYGAPGVTVGGEAGSYSARWLPGDGWQLYLVDGIWISAEDVAYPWLVDNWTLETPIEGVTESITVTRAPAANQDNWTVLDSTIALSVVYAEGSGDSLTVGEEVFDGDTSDARFIGWFRPDAIPVQSSMVDQTFVLGAVIVDYDTPTEMAVAVDKNLTLSGSPQFISTIITVRPRSSVALSFA